MPSVADFKTVLISPKQFLLSISTTMAIIRCSHGYGTNSKTSQQLSSASLKTAAVVSGNYETKSLKGNTAHPEGEICFSV